MSTSRIISFSLVLLAGASGAAWAQDARPGMDRGGSPGDHERWDPAAMRQHMEARRSEHVKALHDVLGIQAGQEGAFTAFAAAMRPPEENRDGDARGGPGGSRGSPGVHDNPRTPRSHEGADGSEIRRDARSLRPARPGDQGALRRPRSSSESRHGCSARTWRDITAAVAWAPWTIVAPMAPGM